MWEPRRLTTLWAFTACYKDNFTFFLITLDYLFLGCDAVYILVWVTFLLSRCPDYTVVLRRYALMSSRKRRVIRVHYNMGHIGLRSWSSRLGPILQYLSPTAL
jgi:hypothetical protein